jgi:hypothetical protein
MGGSLPAAGGTDLNSAAVTAGLSSRLSSRPVICTTFPGTSCEVYFSNASLQTRTSTFPVKSSSVRKAQGLPVALVNFFSTVSTNPATVTVARSSISSRAETLVNFGLSSEPR